VTISPFHNESSPLAVCLKSEIHEIHKIQSLSQNPRHLATVTKPVLSRPSSTDSDYYLHAVLAVLLLHE